MDERPEEIIGQISSSREELGRNLNELEATIRSKFDWRAQFEKKPALILGAALGGGLLLATVFSGGKNSHRRRDAKGVASTSAYSPANTTHSEGVGFAGLEVPIATAPHPSQIPEALEHVKSALVTFGVERMKEFLSDAIPGLEHHLKTAAGSTNASNTDK